MKKLIQNTLWCIGMIGTLAVGVVNADVTLTYNQNAGITYTDTNGKVFENIGTITIKSGDDSITILDRNLGATTNDITSSNSYGYYFQWGNNYGFSPDDFTLDYTEFEATDYSWDNPYVSGNFIAAKYWDTSYNSGLWGGSDDYDNDRGIDTSDGGYARQGPCPAGYHVPSIGEFDELMRIFKSITGGTAQLQTGTNGNLVESNPFANAFKSELHFPIAGFIGWDGVYTGISDTNYSYSYFWSSSFKKANGYLMINHHPTASKKDKVSTRGNNFQQGNAFSIRCFKNTAEDGEEIVLSYDTRGGSAIQAQTLPVGGTGYLPGYTTHKENVELLGWYDEDLLTEFNFEDTILNEDTVIYAKWSDDYVVTFLDFDGSVLKTEVVKHGNEATSPNVSDRDGYEFNGWDVDFSNITEDTTITAQYTPIEYDITYVLNGGTNDENNTGKYTIETPTITLYDADRKGYDFNGWFSDPEFTNQITEITQGSTGDVTLYANWTKKYTGYSGRGHDEKQDETEQDDEPNEIDNTSINTDEPSEEQNYSQEIINAYDFAYKNGITTMDTIEKVEIAEPLTRISMAKMLSQYAINVLGKKPANIVVPDFSDINPELDEEYANAITLAYQLGIMGINIQEFRPFDTVIRAEFATALSRMLYSTPDGEYEGTAEYYVNHIKKLVEEKIITNNDPFLQELRGYVMIILMRTAE